MKYSDNNLYSILRINIIDNINLPNNKCSFDDCGRMYTDETFADATEQL